MSTSTLVYAPLLLSSYSCFDIQGHDQGKDPLCLHRMKLFFRVQGRPLASVAVAIPRDLLAQPHRRRPKVGILVGQPLATPFVTLLDEVLHHHLNLCSPLSAVTIADVLAGTNHRQTDPHRQIHALHMSPQEVVSMTLQWILMMPLCLGRLTRQRNKFLPDDQLCRMKCQDIRERC